MWRKEPNSKILIIFKRNSSIDQLDAHTCLMEKMDSLNELNMTKSKIFSMFYLINKYC
jgi:23S rRNA maturation-related 3'-5' exoribonuclease YhaM